MDTKITPEMLAIIQNEARKIAEEVYATKGTQYNVANVPAHSHNGVDSNHLSLSSIDGVLTLGAQPNILGEDGAMFCNLNLGNQVVTQGNTERGFGVFGTVSQASFYTLPIPVIYGNGVGVDSAFNGGDAPDGTMVFFSNGLTLSGLWIKTQGVGNEGWYRIAPTSVL